MVLSRERFQCCDEVAWNDGGVSHAVRHAFAAPRWEAGRRAPASACRRGPAATGRSGAGTLPVTAGAAAGTGRAARSFGRCPPTRAAAAARAARGQPVRGRATSRRSAQVSTVIQISPTCGHRNFPHPLVENNDETSAGGRCGQAVCGLSKARWARLRVHGAGSVHGPPVAHVPAVVGLTTPDFNLSFSRYESPRMLSVVA